MCPVKQVLLKFSQNSQKNDCAGVSFIRKPQASGLQIYLKETPIRCFTVNFVKFLKRPILLNTYGRLLLDFVLRYRLIHHNEKTENKTLIIHSEAATRGVLQEKAFLEISQSHRKTPVPVSFL